MSSSISTNASGRRYATRQDHRHYQPKRPAVAIVRQNGLSFASSTASFRRCNTRVTADLMDPGGGWTTAGASPLSRKPITVSRLDTDLENLVCRCITSKSGDVTKETQSSFTDYVERRKTSSLDTKSYWSMCRMRRWQWKESNLFQSACVRVQVSEP